MKIIILENVEFENRKFEKEIVLEKDIRHAIHGLEILG